MRKELIRQAKVLDFVLRGAFQNSDEIRAAF